MSSNRNNNNNSDNSDNNNNNNNTQSSQSLLLYGMSYITAKKDISSLAQVNKKVSEENKKNIVWRQRCELKFPEVYEKFKDERNVEWQKTYELSIKKAKVAVAAKYKTLKDFITVTGDFSTGRKREISHLQRAFDENDQVTLDRFFDLMVIEFKSDFILLSAAIFCKQPIEVIEKYLHAYQNEEKIIRPQNFCDTLSHYLRNSAVFSYINNPVTLAVHTNQLHLVEFLISRGFAPHSGNPTIRFSPLYHAAKDKHLDIVKTLLKHKVEESFILIVVYEYIMTNSIHLGAPTHSEPIDLEIMNTLLAQVKLDKEKVDTFGFGHESLLKAAAKSGNIDFVKYLIAGNIPIDDNVNAQERRSTPLNEAIYAGHVEIAKYLIEHGASLGYLNIETLFLDSVTNKRVEMAKLLLHHGAGTFVIKEVTLALALSRALDNQQIEMIEFLVNAGAIVGTYQHIEFMKTHRFDIASILNPEQSLVIGSIDLNLHGHIDAFVDYVHMARRNLLAHVDSEPNNLTLYKLALIYDNKESIQFFQDKGESVELQKKLNDVLQKQFELWKQIIKYLHSQLPTNIDKSTNSWTQEYYKVNNVNYRITCLVHLSDLSNFNTLVEYAKQFRCYPEYELTPQIHTLCKMIREGDLAEDFLKTFNLHLESSNANITPTREFYQPH